MPSSTKGPPPSGREMSPEEKAAFDQRVSDLGTRIGAAKTEARHETAGTADGASKRGMAIGLRMSSELVGAIAVGGLIGHGLDRWFGTGPWLFLLFFMLGFAAGVLNVLRAYRRFQAEIAAATGGNIGKPVADEDD